MDTATIELIDVFEELTEMKRQEKIKKVNFINNITARLLPFMLILFVISRHSTALVNKRLGILFLVLFLVFLGFLIYTIYFNYVNKTLKFNKRVLKFAVFYLLSFYLLFALYQKDSWLKKFIINETQYSPKYEVVLTWIYGKEV